MNNPNAGSRRVRYGLWCLFCVMVAVVCALFQWNRHHDPVVENSHSQIKQQIVEGKTAVLAKQTKARRGRERPYSPPPATLPQPDAAYRPAVDTGLLIIPSLNIQEPIMRIFVRNGEWDISELDASVGHLQTTGEYPGDNFAMTFVGHTTIPPRTGPFAYLYQLGHGEQIIYRWNGIDYVYEVSQILEVFPHEVGTLYEENGDMLMLATCSGWNGSTGIYETRLVTRAELVSQQPALPQFGTADTSELFDTARHSQFNPY